MTNQYSPPNRSVIDLEPVVPWVNVSGEEIPAFGVIQLRQNFDETSKADKPNGTSGLFFVNGPVLVRSDAGTTGESYLWDKPRRVLLEAGATVGDEVGPTEDSWAMSGEGAGWRVLRQAINGVGVVLQTGGGGSVQLAWGNLSQDTGKDDSTLTVDLYRGASLSEFIPFLCGACTEGSGSGSGSGDDCLFYDMDLNLCESIASVTALVPAGYKAGPVGLIKMPVCDPDGSGGGSGSGSSWSGWTVIVGRKLRCVAEIPTEVECCSVTNIIQFTRFSRIWYFGGALEDRLNPCGEGSGSGS